MSEFESMSPKPAGSGTFLSYQSPATPGLEGQGTAPEDFTPLVERAPSAAEGRLVAVQRLAVALPPAGADPGFEGLGYRQPPTAPLDREAPMDWGLEREAEPAAASPVAAAPEPLAPALTPEQQAQFEGALQTLDGVREEIYGRCVEDTVQAILLIARRLVRRELQADAGLVERIVRAALEEVQDESELHVSISDEQARLLGGRGEDLATRLGLNELRLTVDPALTGLGCVVRASHGEIDAMVEAQLNRFMTVLDADFDDDDDDWSMP